MFDYRLIDYGCDRHQKKKKQSKTLKLWYQASDCLLGQLSSSVPHRDPQELLLSSQVDIIFGYRVERDRQIERGRYISFYYPFV